MLAYVYSLGLNMVGIMLLGLLSTATLGAIFFDWFEGDPEPAAVEDELPDPIPGPEPGPVEPDPPVDTSLDPEWLNADRDDPLNVIGTEGDDDLYAQSQHRIFGGPGDDIIRPGHGLMNEVYAGSGDDVVSLNPDPTDIGLTQIDLGPGDDRIIIERFAGAGFEDMVEIEATGGDGSDSFEFKLEVDIGSYADPGDAIAEIKDFDPDEDTVLIELHREAVLNALTLDVTFTQEPVGDGYETELSLWVNNLPDAGEDPRIPNQTIIKFQSDKPFTLDDIDIRILNDNIVPV